MDDRTIIESRSSKGRDASLADMRIVHIIGHAALNGVATSLKALIDAQLEAGYEIMLVHPRKSWIGKQSFFRPIHTLDSTFSMAPVELRRVGYAIRDWGRTLLHAHGSGANKYAMVFTIFDGVPTVMTAHARRYQLPWMFAHGVVGLSAPTIDYYAKRFLVSRRRIFNVPNMFDVRKLAPVTQAARDRARGIIGLNPQSLVIGSVGAIDQRKRQADVVRILSRLVRSGVDAHLLLIGRPPSDPEIVRELDEVLRDPLVANRVHLTGHRTDAVALLPAINVFLCTSAVEEAPIAPLEAMAQGIPVVSTRVGNMADLLPASRLFAVGDIDGLAGAAATLLGAAPMAASAGLADRETVAKKLAPSVILPQIDAIYRKAISSARDRGRKYIERARAKIRSFPAE